jgi:hypothetical protein
MDREALLEYLERIDQDLSGDVTLYVYGSGAQILLGEEFRTSLDLDVAGPYCSGNLTEFREAAAKCGLPVNPEETYQGGHIEWIGPLRLILPAPEPDSDLILWQGDHLVVKTVGPARLIASKLIRYDTADQADIRFLMETTNVDMADIDRAVSELPDQFRDDPVVRENLENLKTDMGLWEKKK